MFAVDSKGSGSVAPEIQSIQGALSILQSQLEKCKKDIEKLQELKKKALENPASFISKISSKSSIENTFIIPQRQNIVKIPPLNLARIKNIVFSKPHLIQDKAVHIIFNYIESMEEHAMRSVFASSKAAGEDRGNPAAFLQSFPSMMAFANNPSLAPLVATQQVRAHNLRSSSSSSLPAVSPPFTLKTLVGGGGSGDSSASVASASASNSLFGGSQSASSSSAVPKVSLKKARKLPGYRLLQTSRSDMEFAKSWKDDDLVYPDASPSSAAPAKRSHLGGGDDENSSRLLGSSASNEKILKLEGTSHVGYKCDLCHLEPIVGARWECKNCPAEASIDLCNECIGVKFERDHHKPWHSFVRYV